MPSFPWSCDWFVYWPKLKDFTLKTPVQGSITFVHSFCCPVQKPHTTCSYTPYFSQWKWNTRSLAHL